MSDVVRAVIDLPQEPTKEKLRAHLDLLTEQESQLKKEINIVKSKLMDCYQDGLAEAIKHKGDMFGSFPVESGVTITVPKKVEWNQAMLAESYKGIGETADQYIDVKYSIKENSYNGWPDLIKKQFADARTEKAGKATIKFKEEEA